jgi:glutaredoxin 3
METVKIYSTPTCVYCNLAKQFFDENKVKYEEYNVAEDLAKRTEMVEKSGQMGVPVIAISTKGEEEIIVGFQEDRIKGLLGL